MFRVVFGVGPQRSLGFTEVVTGVTGVTALGEGGAYPGDTRQAPSRDPACRINAAFRLVSERRIHAAAKRIVV